MTILAERLARIDWLLLDVDGVLTDGRIIYGDDGTELKAFHVRDGSGLVLWRKAGKHAGLITGRSSSIVQRRAQELALDIVVQGVADKEMAFREILQQQGIRAEQVGYIGDDVPDLAVMAGCGLAVAVADACVEVRAAAHHVTQAPGGGGAVRETIEWLLHAQGWWSKLVGGEMR